MIRIVLDTRVLGESFWDGPARGVIELWKSGEIGLCVSQPILREYSSLVGRLGASQKEREEFLSMFTNNPLVANAGSARRVEVVKEDPADDMFLDCAVAGGADFVITNDPYLLELESYRGIAIAMPVDFVKAHGVAYRH